MLEPTEALESTENALRLVVRQLLGTEWRGQVTAERLAQFEQRMAEESKRRDGVQTSTDLLEFTDFTDLTRIILKNWETFKNVFDDQARLKVYFGFFEDVRNSIAHSRALVEYEREAFSGISKHIRQQIALYRMNKSPQAAHYPLIESAIDNFGRVGLPNTYGANAVNDGWPELSVGDRVTIECRATDPRSRTLIWQLGLSPAGNPGTHYPLLIGDPIQGSDVTFRFNIRHENVSLKLIASVFMRNSGRFHVNDQERVQERVKVDGVRMSPGVTRISYDDVRHFLFVVNPPFED